ncbi:glycosyltransferase, partial [Campylobacter coli]|nr:glycosyltransferase [Campylobacter coli]
NQLAEVVQNFKGIDTTILNEHSLRFYKRLNRKNCAKNYDIKVSIIVPVYNVEKYLRQCLDSIIDQTLEEIEIILIDDGSTDGSGSICDEYAAMDNRIVLIHKENAGLGAAYNTGLEIAKGEYIGFVESDDWVELNMFEELYNKAREFDVDVVKSNFFDYNSVRQIDRKRHNLESLVPENIVFKIEEYPQIFSMHSSIWAGLYKKSFLIKEKIKFPTTKSASYQDFYFNTLVLMKANIVITYEHFLHYRQEFGHLSSIARKDKMLLMFIEQFKNVYHVIKDYYNYKNIESYFFNSGFRTCYYFYNQIMDAYKIIFF